MGSGGGISANESQQVILKQDRTGMWHSSGMNVPERSCSQ